MTQIISFDKRNTEPDNQGMTYRTEAERLGVRVSTLHRFIHGKQIEASAFILILKGIDEELGEIIDAVVKGYRARLLLRKRKV